MVFAKMPSCETSIFSHEMSPSAKCTCSIKRRRRGQSHDWTTALNQPQKRAPKCLLYTDLSLCSASIPGQSNSTSEGRVAHLDPSESTPMIFRRVHPQLPALAMDPTTPTPPTPTPHPTSPKILAKCLRSRISTLGAAAPKNSQCESLPLLAHNIQVFTDISLPTGKKALPSPHPPTKRPSSARTCAPQSLHNLICDRATYAKYPRVNRRREN